MSRSRSLSWEPRPSSAGGAEAETFTNFCPPLQSARASPRADRPTPEAPADRAGTRAGPAPAPESRGELGILAARTDRDRYAESGIAAKSYQPELVTVDAGVRRGVKEGSGLIDDELVDAPALNPLAEVGPSRSPVQAPGDAEGLIGRAEARRGRIDRVGPHWIQDDRRNVPGRNRSRSPGRSGVVAAKHSAARDLRASSCCCEQDPWVTGMNHQCGDRRAALQS